MPIELLCVNSGAISTSCEDRIHDPAMHIRQSSIDSVVAEGQAVMVDAQEVQDRGVQVVAVGLAFGGLPAPGVALAVSDSAFDSRAGQPGDGGAAVVVAAGGTLGKWHAAEFGVPENECVFEQAPCLQVVKQAGDRTIDRAGRWS